jgi:flagellar biosynthetic protein FliR
MGLDSSAVLGFPVEMLQRLDLIWTFILLLIRFGVMFLVLPGIGSVSKMGTIKTPAVFIMALTATTSSAPAVLPADWSLLIAQASSEALLGFGLGLIPYLVISGVQTGAQVASTTMGLGMSTLIDPTTGQQTSDMSIILGDLMIIIFLFLGGHHAVIYAAAGLGGQIIPGTYLVTANSIDLLARETGAIFKVGLLISAPVLVALLLTNFVMGLISKAVPTVNIFIISFPLTIGIGLIIFLLALPDIAIFMERQFAGVEEHLLMLIRDATLKSS